MKIPKTFRLDATIVAILQRWAEKTERTETQLVERAIQRCYGKEGQ